MSLLVVKPGFIVSTVACNNFYNSQSVGTDLPEGLFQVYRYIHDCEIARWRGESLKEA